MSAKELKQHNIPHMSDKYIYIYIIFISVQTWTLEQLPRRALVTAVGLCKKDCLLTSSLANTASLRMCPVLISFLNVLYFLVWILSCTFWNPHFSCS